MKRERSDIFYSILCVPVDALALLLAGVVTWYLRFRVEVPGLREAGNVLTPEQLLRALFWTVPLFLLVFAVAGLYARYHERRFVDEFFRVLLAVSTGTLAVIVVLFFRQAADTSRFVVLAGWILAIVFVTLGRYIVRGVER
ncbi:MAG: ArsB/NhaD family transporter, partial [Candidatus Andersenbacteria bacterium]